MSEKAGRLKVLGHILLAFSPLLALFAGVSWAAGSYLSDLVSGEDATVTEIARCTGSSQSLSSGAPYCAGKWRYADARTGGGHIEGGQSSPGDTIFAGDGFAYGSTSSLHWRAWGFTAVSIGFLGVGVALGVTHRSDVKRKRGE